MIPSNVQAVATYFRRTTPGRVLAAAILGRLTTFMLGEPFTSLDRYTGSASREYYEKHSILLAISIMVTVGSPFLGLVLARWVGVVAGLLIGVLTLIVGFRAVIKVREIQEGS